MFAHDTNKTSDTPSPASVQCTTSAPVSMITGEEIADGTEDVVEIEEIEEVEEIEEIEEVDEEVVYLEEKASGKETSVSEEEKLKLISPVKVASMQIPDSKENSPEVSVLATFAHVVGTEICFSLYFPFLLYMYTLHI